jgi:NAD dependent epimerase/dehydratase
MPSSPSYSKILVTGAGGFIGSHLSERLVNSGFRVRAFVHYNSRQDWGCLEELPRETLTQIDVFSGDIRDPVCARQAAAKCDMVFHLAALIGIPYSYRAPASYLDTNVHGTLNLLNASIDSGIKRFVHTSTSEVYGTALYTPIDEKHPLQGQSPYSASKISADKVVESYGLSFGLPVTTVRPFNTYGPRQSARAIIPTIISQIASGRKEIRLGSLTPVRDLTFVSDTVEGFVAIANCERALQQVFNLGSGEAVAIGDLAQKIIALMGAKVTVIEDPERVRPDGSEVMQLISNHEKVREVVGWKPRYTLEEGLKETIEYVRKNIHRFKPEFYAV